MHVEFDGTPVPVLVFWPTLISSAAPETPDVPMWRMSRTSTIPPPAFPAAITALLIFTEPSEPGNWAATYTVPLMGACIEVPAATVPGNVAVLVLPLPVCIAPRLTCPPRFASAPAAVVAQVPPPLIGTALNPESAVPAPL